MADLRSILIDRMNQLLAERTAKVPNAIPISVPTGELADLVIAAVADGRGVPQIPTYDQALFAQRSWSQPVSSDYLTAGFSIPTVSVQLVNLSEMGRPSQVQLAILAPSGDAATVALPAGDAEEFALCVLAVVAAARDLGPERGDSR